MEEHSSALKKNSSDNFCLWCNQSAPTLSFPNFIHLWIFLSYLCNVWNSEQANIMHKNNTYLEISFQKRIFVLVLEGCNTWSLARKIYDPSQHTLEKKMEFMASIISIFFSIKCKKLDVYQQNVLFHQTNTRSKVFILHLNCFISFFIHYIWVILISNNPSLSIHFTTAFQRPYFNFTGQTYL